MRSVCLLLSCTDNIIFDRGRIFDRPKLFLPEKFWQKKLRTEYFRRASFTFSHFSGLMSYVWDPISDSAMEYGALVALSFQPSFFFDFPQYFDRNFVQKLEFSMNFLHYVKFSASSRPQSDEHQLN